MSDQGMGKSVLRKEDHRFITGQGTYTDDIKQPNQLYAYFLRSPVAHAILKSISTTKAEGSDGVVAVYTGKDTDAALPCGWETPTKAGTPPMAEPPIPNTNIERISGYSFWGIQFFIMINDCLICSEKLAIAPFISDLSNSVFKAEIISFINDLSFLLNH